MKILSIYGAARVVVRCKRKITCSWEDGNQVDRQTVRLEEEEEEEEERNSARKVVLFEA